jgi:undecaprenyl-diphosphatase
MELIVLSFIQGIAEWLPISSEGLSVFILLKFFSSAPSEAISYAIYLHLGTMLAAIARFRVEFFRVISLSDRHLLKIIVVTSIFTAITGIPLLNFLKSFQSGFEVTLMIGLLLIVTGIVLRIPTAGFRRVEDVNELDMILLGLFQGFAVLPGISRSGTTISLLLLRRMDKEDALKISFIVSVPAVMGAVAIEVLGNVEFSAIGAIGVLVTFLTGYLTMDFLLKAAKKLNFSYFCIILGLLTISITLLTSF